MPVTVAEIRLDRVLKNYQAVTQQVSPARVIPVIKADGYGHGALPIARYLIDHHAISMMAVAQFKEALELREAGIEIPLLIFGRLFPDQIQQAARSDFKITVFGSQDLEWIEEATLRQPVGVHVNMDTGMGRAGHLWGPKSLDFFKRLKAHRNMRWEGLYTHFATADESDKSYTRYQTDRFRSILNQLKSSTGLPPLVHMANSGGIMDHPASYTWSKTIDGPQVFQDAVRLGISLYGIYPSGESSRTVPLEPAMNFKTYVAQLRRLPAGHNVSYGRRWKTPQETRIAVIPVGYADGFRRSLTNCGEVLIRGQRFPVVGTVTMDQTMIHIGDAPIAVGDEVLLWGKSSQGTLPVSEVADLAGTIAYETTCGVSKRVPRVFMEGST